MDLEALRQLLGGLTVEDTPLGQMLIEKGIEQGIEQGIEKGIEQGIEQGQQRGQIEGLRESVRQVLRHRLGRVPDWAEQRLLSVDSAGELLALLDRLLDAATEEEAGSILG
jgi:hypothetical protein